jgi:hypothetical protein
MVPTLGSIVQNGKLAACALALLKQLNKVDLPTLGNPTIPHFNAMLFLVYALWFLTTKFYLFLLNKLFHIHNQLFG